MAGTSPGLPILDTAEALVMKIRHEPIAHVELIGTFDTASCAYFDAFTRCGVPLHDGWLLIHAAQLSMLTSSGAGTLIRLASKVSKDGGGLVLVVPQGQVRKVIDFMRLDMVIDTFDAMAQAIAHIHDQTAKQGDL